MSQASIWALDQPPELHSLLRSSLEIAEDHECDYCEMNFQNRQIFVSSENFSDETDYRFETKKYSPFGKKMDPFCKKSLFLKAEKMTLIFFENNN